jgi:hypothetical protein
MNKERARILNQNIKKLNIKNVEVINGDALNKGVIQKIAKESPDIVFFDTERPEESDRTLNQIQPPINKILESYSPLTLRIAIEIPPFTNDIETIKKRYNFESEFLSLNDQLNRLTLYFNELKTCEKSVIALPSKEKLTNSEKEIKAQKVVSAKNFKNFKYLYPINPAVVVAGLTEEIAAKFNSPIIELNKPALISNNLLKSYLLTSYQIIRICENRREKILYELKDIGAGKVTLRYNILPEEYWEIRKFYESRLSGKKEVSLFVNDKQREAIICKKI